MKMTTAGFEITQSETILYEKKDVFIRSGEVCSFFKVYVFLIYMDKFQLTTLKYL